MPRRRPVGDTHRRRSPTNSRRNSLKQPGQAAVSQGRPCPPPATVVRPRSSSITRVAGAIGSIAAVTYHTDRQTRCLLESSGPPWPPLSFSGRSVKLRRYRVFCNPGLQYLHPRYMDASIPPRWPGTDARVGPGAPAYSGAHIGAIGV